MALFLSHVLSLQNNQQRKLWQIDLSTQNETTTIKEGIYFEVQGTMIQDK